jgi:hypothetical protein
LETDARFTFKGNRFVGFVRSRRYSKHVTDELADVEFSADSDSLFGTDAGKDLSNRNAVNSVSVPKTLFALPDNEIAVILIHEMLHLGLPVGWDGQTDAQIEVQGGNNRIREACDLH